MIDIELLISRGATYRDLDENEILFSEGNRCNYYYQVLSGQLKWVNISDEGKEFLQLIIEPSQSIGELPLFDNGVYAATAISIQKSTVIRLQKNKFHQLISEYPEIHLQFSKLLTERLRFKFFMLKELSTHNPVKLITALFKNMKDNNYYICQKCFQVKLTRQQIADHTGLRVETVIRVIRNLQDKGIVKILKGKVYYPNMIPIIMNE